MTTTVRARTGHPALALLSAVPVAALGGLMGLGGAEFRLPVLMGLFGYPARRVVPLNLAVCLVAICASLTIRARSLSLVPVEPFAAVILALVAGAVATAVVGASLLQRLSDRRLERTILTLLVVISVALIVEGFLGPDATGFLPESTAARVAAGVVFGLGIGLVSSLLGVAGGEVIIPTLVFAYGADIKAAGTASLLVSLPTVAVVIARNARLGGYVRAALAGTVGPKGVGSIVGTVGGGLLVGIVPASVLKVGLGLVLIASAARTFHGHRRQIGRPPLSNCRSPLAAPCRSSRARRRALVSGDP